MAWRKVRLLASAARTAALTVSKQETPNIEKLIVFIDVTASAATPSVTFTIRGYKPNPDGVDDTYDILASAAVTGVGNTVLKVSPGITAAANAAVADNMPGEWDINITVADADSLTYSVSAWIYERP